MSFRSFHVTGLAYFLYSLILAVWPCQGLVSWLPARLGGVVCHVSSTAAAAAPGPPPPIRTVLSEDRRPGDVELPDQC